MTIGSTFSVSCSSLLVQASSDESSSGESSSVSSLKVEMSSSDEGVRKKKRVIIPLLGKSESVSYSLMEHRVDRLINPKKKLYECHLSMKSMSLLTLPNVKNSSTLNQKKPSKKKHPKEPLEKKYGTLTSYGSSILKSKSKPLKKVASPTEVKFYGYV